MNGTSKTIAIILASGTGSRFGATLPKQFCMLANRPLLMHTIDRFSRVMPFDDILLVIDPAMQQLWQQQCNCYNFISPRIAFGGATRTESLANAMQSIVSETDDTIIMIHDGARPLVSNSLIRKMMAIPTGYVGALPATAITDTLRHVDTVNGNSTTVDRSQYVAVQTPQTFTLGDLRKSFLHYREHVVTDDATLVQTITGGRIAFIEGEYTNIKVTNPTDMAIAETLLKILKENK